MSRLQDLPVDALLDRLEALLKTERAAEEAAEREALVGKPLAAQEADGQLVRHLEIVDEEMGPAGTWSMTLAHSDRSPLPRMTAGPGDPIAMGGPEVLASPTRDGHTRAVLGKATATTISVLLDARSGDELPRQKLAVWPMGSPVTFERARSAIQRLKDPRPSRANTLRDMLLGKVAADAPDAPPSNLDLGSLNDAQRRAVVGALMAPDVFLIHGPPGTGKTTTAGTLARLAIDRGERVLLAAASNTGADELARAVIKQGKDAIRVGHPARVDESLHDALLVEKIRAHPRWKIANGLLRQAEMLRTRSNQSRKNFREAREERNARRDEWRAMVQDARTYIAQAEEDVLRHARALCCTLAVAGGEQLRGEEFDLLILDEASQATLPLSFIPLPRVQRVVLVGDHKQLPPTIISPDAERGGLSTTAFDLLADKAPGVMLEVQHRMHHDIMRFPSDASYSGKLIAHPSVENRDLRSVLGKEVRPEFARPFLFIDTAGTGFSDEQPEGSQSQRNPGEAAIAAWLVEKMLEEGLATDQIAVIAPYRAQVTLLRERMPELVAKGLEVDSVDAFQGREKEAVIVSLTRSNEEGIAGFVDDQRRLNVAITRARSSLIVIGDSATIGVRGHGAALVQHAQQTGAYESAYALPDFASLVP